MGLCKCPKRNVTNLFCYEHRVNVCQSCMVQSHPKCVVQTYLKWLRDSEYSPVCTLCDKHLNTAECVRLVCYHVFHWHCVDAYARNLPATTAPAGYKCPSCNDPILPPSKLASPVASLLREKMSSVNWARVGLGLPTVTEDAPVVPESESILNHSRNASPRKMSNESTDTVVHVEDSLLSRADDLGTARRLHGLSTERLLLVDDDESKYRRRYAVVRLPFWLKSAANSMNILKRGKRSTCKLVVTGILGVSVICLLFTFWGRIASSDNPELDPHNNPLIHFGN